MKKEYINKKLTSLLFLDALYYDNSNGLLLWTLDASGDCDDNLKFVENIARGSFEILKPSLNNKIMESKSISINQQDLNELIKEIYYVLDESIIRLNNM